LLASVVLCFGFDFGFAVRSKKTTWEDDMGMRDMEGTRTLIQRRRKRNKRKMLQKKIEK
jgi:hypothetical protein